MRKRREPGAGEPFQNLVRLVVRLPLAVGVGDFVPHLAGFGAEFGIALDGAADLAFEGGLARHQAVIAQADELAGVRFVLGEQAAEGGLRGAQVVHTGGGEGVQLHDAGLQAGEAQRQRGVAQEGELRGGGEASGGAGIAAEKYQVAFLHAFGAPFQIARSGGGLAVFIGAQKGDVEAVAEIGDAVALAAEEGDGVFGSEDQADIAVAAVLVEIVAAAGKQADHGADVVGLGGALLLDASDGGIAQGKRCAGGLDGFGDVFDGQQDVGVHTGARQFRRLAGRLVTVAKVIVLRSAEAGETIRGQLAGGQEKACGRDERARAAGQFYGGEAEVIEKRGLDLKTELLFYGIFGELVVWPQALAGVDRDGPEAGDQE